MNALKDEEYGTLQTLIDVLFRDGGQIDQIDLVIQGETIDLCEDLQEICKLVPPGRYSRRKLCDQLNSSISGHGWGFRYGTVE